MYYSWKEACQESGYNDLPEIPHQIRVVFAYKGGEVKRFDSVEEAKKFSTNYEVTYQSHPLRDEIIRDRDNAYKKAFDLWHANLRNTWSELSAELYDLCYNEAYSRGHSSGHDEVASYMNDVVWFARKVLELKK